MFSKKDLTNIEGIMMLSAIKAHCSKRHAAKDLNVSLDTMDKYLHILEDEFGAKLLTTSGRGCFLTPQGEKILQNADLLKKCMENLYHMKDMETETKGEVKIAYDLNVRINYHTEIIKYLFRKYPEIELNIDNISGCPDMKNAEYDIYLSYSVPEGDDLVIITRKQVPFKFFATQKYIEENKFPHSIDDLLKHHYLILRKDMWKKISSGGQVELKQQKGLVLTNSAFVVNDIAANGYGIGVMPYYFKKLSKDLVCLDNIECHVVNTLYLISHKNRKDIPKVRVVLNFYKEMLKNL